MHSASMDPQKTYDFDAHNGFDGRSDELPDFYDPDDYIDYQSSDGDTGYQQANDHGEDTGGDTAVVGSPFESADYGNQTTAPLPDDILVTETRTEEQIQLLKAFLDDPHALWFEQHPSEHLECAPQGSLTHEIGRTVPPIATLETAEDYGPRQEQSDVVNQPRSGPGEEPHHYKWEDTTLQVSSLGPGAASPCGDERAQQYNAQDGHGTWTDMDLGASSPNSERPIEMWKADQHNEYQLAFLILPAPDPAPPQYNARLDDPQPGGSRHHASFESEDTTAVDTRTEDTATEASFPSTCQEPGCTTRHKPFKNKSDWQKHVNTHGEHRCNVCRHTFGCEEALKQHQDKPPPSCACLRSELRFPCAHCSKSFSRPDFVTRHMRKHHPEELARRRSRAASSQTAVESG